MIGTSVVASALQFGLIIGEAVIVGLGLFISWLAYRGYRKHNSRPMLFIAGGFVLLVGGPATLVILNTFVFQGTDIGYAVARQLVTITGMGSILYGLWTEP